MTNSNHVELRDITKSYGSTTIIQTTNITISQGEFVSILGPSGCGKSTILSMIAGLAFPSSGTIFTNGQQITSPGPDRGMVFQHHALLPWMTAQGNIEFGLKSARPELTATERRAVAARFLDQVGLAHAASRRPARLSGGMQQRVGLARAFAVDPEILLLDEPFGALDALTRRELQLQLRNVWEANRRTVIMVTHDVDEAILLSDRILVMAQGPESSVIADIEVALESDTESLRRKLLGLLEHSPQPKLEPSLQ
ncbi:ABC transporter ATP-binding protein [Corynebacterium freiburgense]|uniref:ABC transporter ATP-binding protein n=1 Tax=Corynebacterium freiburgense TaxID=556548 RepID=UPI0004069EDB|nr:ABC transporter ATP-binding protein [Corynebacterium freiburgense]WJZ03211.1 Bicarbonate transport ATP-binding protein CmpD [Corynebacterium freiburgense]